MVTEVRDAEEKQRIAREILTALPEWFGIPEALEDYVRSSAAQRFLCAWDGDQPVGFLTLKETGRATAEVAVMGVVKTHHRRGIGAALMERAKAAARADGYRFLQVKTVASGHYPEYDRTNRFYLAQGFAEFEVLPTLWGEANPCQIYVLSLNP